DRHIGAGSECAALISRRQPSGRGGEDFDVGVAGSRRRQVAPVGRQRDADARAGRVKKNVLGPGGRRHYEPTLTTCYANQGGRGISNANYRLDPSLVTNRDESFQFDTIAWVSIRPVATGPSGSYSK